MSVLVVSGSYQSNMVAWSELYTLLLENKAKRLLKGLRKLVQYAMWSLVDRVLQHSAWRWEVMGIDSDFTYLPIKIHLWSLLSFQELQAVSFDLQQNRKMMTRSSSFILAITRSRCRAKGEEFVSYHVYFVSL